MPLIIQDEKARKQALNPAQSFIVQAPAGSGKTELLTQRYLALLSHAQKAPEEIVAITFTKKAAAEMRARVMHALEFALTEKPDETDYRHLTWQLAHNVLKKDAQFGWSLIHNPNRLRILTIDALSSFLCGKTPFLTQFGGSPTLCEQAESLYRLAAQRLLQNESEKLSQLLLHLDNNVIAVETLLTDLLKNRDQWLPSILYSKQNQSSLRSILENNLKKLTQEKLQIAFSHLPEHVKQTILLLAHHAADYFIENEIDDPITACTELFFDQEPTTDDFSAWFGLTKLLLTEEGGWRKKIDKRNGFLPNDSNKSLLLGILTELSEYEAFRESLTEIASLPPMFYSDSQWETLTALTELLPQLAAQLTLVFQEKAQIDFIELNLAALKALGSDDAPTDLALYLDYQIQHLLIDEFQDTSVVHLHLLEKIISGWQPDDGRTLFVVGDPMQSIYRFRNAEVGLFLRAQQQGIGCVHLEPLTLTMNFRSQENMVSWFNNTFQTIFPAVSDIATGCVPYTKAIAAKPAVENSGVFFYPINSDDKAAEAQLLAEKIKAIRLNNSTESIAILVRSRSQLIPIIRTLQLEALPFQAIDIEKLTDRLEIIDLISLTRALLHRSDRIAWLAILRAPFCGLTLADITAIATDAANKTIWESILCMDTISTLSQDGLYRLNSLKNTIKNAFSTQYQLPISQWIENTWIALQGPACLLSENELDNTQAYFNLLSKMEDKSELICVENIIEKCEKLFANANNADPSAIQIMTIHKSKGLEFDHVFLPGLEHQTPAIDRQLIRWLDRPNAFGGDDLLLAPIQSTADNVDPLYQYLKKIESQKQDFEITRLLYVAATRAKKTLHLSTTLKNSIRNQSFLKKLFPIYESMIPKNQAELQESNTTDTQPSLLFSRITAMPSFFESDEIKAPAVKIDIRLHSQSSRIIGTVIHELFESIAKTGEKNKMISRSRLQSLGLLTHEIPDAIELIQTAIQNALSDERGRWILSDTHYDARCEWALTYATENDIQHCVIDRTFIDNDIRWIIDYKTSTPGDNESLNDFLIREKKTYESQLTLYADMISQNEKSPIQLGLYFPLCCGWIEWEYCAQSVCVPQT